MSGDSPLRIPRRELLAFPLLLALAGPASALMSDDNQRFGMIGKMRAQPGKRAELIRLLTAEVGTMPGCLSYIVAEDMVDPDLIWITEAWDKKASHEASLQLPSVRSVISKAMPLIAGMEPLGTTRPVGGVGLG